MSGTGATFDSLSAEAATARDANDLPRAIELYREALKAKPDWAEGWWFLGTLSYDSEKYADGRDALRHFVELKPLSAPAWGLLGLCEFSTADYSRALVDVQRSLSLGPTGQSNLDSVLRYHEALLLVRKGEFDGALKKFKWFASGGMPSVPVLTGLGLAALRSPRLPNEIPGEEQELYLGAGKASFYGATGDVQQADQAFGVLLARYPHAPEVHCQYGLYLLPISLDRAIEQFTRELEIAPKNSRARSMLAWALLTSGNTATALPYADRAYREEPESATAQFVFGRVLVETGELKQGIERLEAAEKMEPDNLEHHLALATAYSKAGRPDEARRERRESLAMALKGGDVAEP